MTHAEAIKKAHEEVMRCEADHKAADAEHRLTRAKRSNAKHALRDARAKLDWTIKNVDAFVS